MNKIFLALALALVGAPAGAVAVYETTCLKGGCLEDGWTGYDHVRGGSALVQCETGGCTEKGWSESIIGTNMEQVIRCEKEGCFNMGYTAYDRFTGQENSRTICNSDGDGHRDCLTMGWVMFENIPGAAVIQFSCVDHNCREKGWNIFGPRNATQRVRCKAGGCFTKGWVVHQP